MQQGALVPGGFTPYHGNPLFPCVSWGEFAKSSGIRSSVWGQTSDHVLQFAWFATAPQYLGSRSDQAQEQVLGIDGPMPEIFEGLHRAAYRFSSILREPHINLHSAWPPSRRRSFVITMDRPRPVQITAHDQLLGIGHRGNDAQRLTQALASGAFAITLM